MCGCMMKTMTNPVRKHYHIEPETDRVIRRPDGTLFALGRHVNHDPRSRRFAFRAQQATLAPVFHERHVPIFDQGSLGSCTGNAALGILATGPYWDAEPQSCVVRSHR